MAEKNAAEYTVPGLSLSTGRRTAEILQGRLHALNDLQLTLKHAHWNVVGPGFIGVHEMLDPQIELVRGMVDVLAERIATLGVSPAGTPGALVAARAWDDYTLGRASTLEHLAALDLVYDGVVTDHRAAIDATDGVGQAGQLMAARARNAAAAAAELALTETARALGPGPLTSHEEHARRVADLTVYVRQHHGDRDLARTGSLLVGPPG